MTNLDRIHRLAEYWCYLEVRRPEMAAEILMEMKRMAQDCFVAGMEFNRDAEKNPDFEEYFTANLKIERTF